MNIDNKVKQFNVIKNFIITKIKGNKDYIRLESQEDIIKEKKKNLREFNYGLGILKVYLEFLVLIVHNFKKSSTDNKIILYITKDRKLHVPSFFIMSFYFMNRNLVSFDINKIFNRLLKLLIPYIIWPLIIWKLNHFFNIKYKNNLPDTFQELIMQLLWGHRFIPQLWFMWNLIIITLLFYIIIYIFRNHIIFTMQIILISFYVVQYSEYSYRNIFLKYPRYNHKTLGLFFESVPFAVTGFILGFFKFFDFLKKHPIKSQILSLIIYKVFADYEIFCKIKGVIYQGIKLNIQSLCIIFFFSIIPFDKIKNKFIVKFLVLITNYTAGVYYLHFSIRFYFGNYLDSIKKGTFIGMIITYLICYFICFLGMIIFGKTPIKYLFC